MLPLPVRWLGRKPWLVSGVLVVGAGLAAYAALNATADCPPGYKAVDPAEVAQEFQPRIGQRALRLIRERYGERGCLWRKGPEAFMEVAEALDGRAAGIGPVPEGAQRRAVEQKQSMMALQKQIVGADGHWEPYGIGPQVQDEIYVDGSRDGIPENAGRVDDFAYDHVAKRLFAAVGNGGIWVSEATDADNDGDLDVSTLGEHWRSIGDGLPTQVTSAVAWTPAGKGRVIALTGEHPMGGNIYVGLGAYWSDDLGKTWHHAAGVPDGAMAFRLAVDLSNPEVVYAATGMGLFRSVDAGETYRNVKLPTSEDCAGVERPGKCGLANIVTDVVIRQPGGLDPTGLSQTSCDPKGCTVLAAVGYRAGDLAYADGTPQSPGNGLYRSDNGEVGSFKKLNVSGDGLSPEGFTTQKRIGRVELGATEGPLQDHNVVYAIVEDALLFRNSIPFLDIPSETPAPAVPEACEEFDPDSLEYLVCTIYLGGYGPTTINGVYVSRDFGLNWLRLADDVELAYNVTTGSSLVGVAALGIAPGVQAWYDLWIRPDPTTSIDGLPNRVLFGMEELWKNRNNLLPVIGTEQTPDDFKVIGTYFAGETCLFLIGNIGPPTPVCPTYDGVINGTTTHPDQHGAIFVPDEENGGVWLFAGNDGGVFKQYSANPITDDFANNKWGKGSNGGFYTLMNYGIAVAKDGTVWYGLQDNSSGKIEPGTRRQVRTYVGDGVWAAVDPDDSRIAYVQTPGLAINKTTDGGITNTSIEPPYAVAGTKHFFSPFMLDPTDARHLVAVGTKVVESLAGANSDDSSWKRVFDLGTDPASGAEHIVRWRALDVQADAVYVGFCGPCNVLGGVNPGTVQFQRGLATNVGGAKPPRRGKPDGWHFASARGLPNRFIYGVEIDPANPKTVYVVLGGYSTARWLPPGQYEDANANIGRGHVFKSTDAGETFRDISGNLPDTIVSAIMQRGGQLIAATDIGAFISSDLNGSSWAPLGDLPSVPVNQLVLKPDDPNLLFAGTFGRGVQVYRFEGAAAMAAPLTAPARAEGRGLFLGAYSPALLLGLALLGLARRRG